jgi:colanic acid biosynthesis glycosyl transferase WcaI
VNFLLLNQTFHPDEMATGQYLTEVALRLVERGHAVTVVTSRRAYDRPERKFPKQETWRGIRIFRVASTGFGKGAKWRRAADFGSFIACCFLRLLRLSRPDVVVALTSPPLISFLGSWVAKLRRSRFVYWVMDFNPDEAIAAGWLTPGSVVARLLEWMSRVSLKRAARIIALDRFMRDRIVAKGIAADKVAIIPPWSHDNEVRFDPEGRDRFRKTHGLNGKFVVMYSGNHSPCHPLDTLLATAGQLADDPRFVFCFVGGGSEFRKIQQMVADGKEWMSKIENPKNILCLPYQPLAELAGSLSAADLQVVVMGDPFVGLIHPCKIYNALAVGAPILYVGPESSHLSEILEALGSRVCARLGHGDVDGCATQISRIAGENQRGESKRYETVTSQFSRRVLLAGIVAELERGSRP